MLWSSALARYCHYSRSSQRVRDRTEIVPDDAKVAHERHFIQGEGTASLADTDIARAISRFADEKDVDLIVTSTHGRSGFLRALMGSVAPKVVGRATRPVLTVKLPNQSA